MNPATVDLDAVTDHLRTAERTRTVLALWTAVGDVPVLVAEVHRGRMLLAVGQLAYADLFAAARATLGADADGEPDPLWYLRDELTAQHERGDTR
jgi:hypothetical protein